MRIRLERAIKKYNGKEVLYIDNLEFKEGMIYALIGLNGSGKSTLLKCISGIEGFDQGDVIYCGNDFNGGLNENISVMLQSPYMFNKSIIDNISIGLKFRKLDKEIIKNRLDKYLKYFNMKDLLNNNVKQLSGGEKAKVALLRVAVLESEVTLLDEPTASMDVESTLEAEELMKDMIRDNRSVILVTHDLMQAERIADYVIFLDKGRVIEQGLKKDIFTNPKNDLVRSMLGKRIKLYDKDSN